MLLADQKVYLDSLLSRQDKLSMACSVEARVPFCHAPLTEVVNTIPNSIRSPGGVTKPILKEIAKKYLPRSLVERRKVGLTLPLNDWLLDPNGLGRYLELLTTSNSKVSDFGDHKKIKKAVEDFRQRKPSLLSIPVLINLEVWLQSQS